MFGWMHGSQVKRQTRPFSADIDEAGFPAELTTFCDAVRRDIADINDATQWTEALFEPLEAEVEVQRSDGPQRQVRDLISAIREDEKSSTFLALGEPGSGKSVALRKLTLDLMDDATRSGRLPIYINLKECRVDWSTGTTAAISLYDFVVQHLRDRYNIVAAQFIGQYFDRLYRTGHLFLILDSFDEIPAILDATEHSDQLRDVSRAVFELIQAPGRTQGVIASRYYKKPMLVGQTVTTLDIRPFTETKIRSALERTRRFPEPMLRALFADRPDLVSVAQNPFSATMLARYVADRHALPEKQSDLFAATISDRLDGAADWLRRASLARADLEAGATAIAVAMFTSRDIGLDATVAELSGADVPGGSVERITDALAYAKIGRFSPGPERRFSFVHRRFNEYYLVQKLLQAPSLASLQAIPTDNRWRDTLTLYCEVASEAEAVRIANFCWQHVARLGSQETLTDEEKFAGVQCLRFLRDAFTNRLSAIEDIRGSLTETVLGVLNRELQQKEVFGHFDVILVKLVVEAVGLLPQNDIARALQIALEIDHGWISQTALRSCRSLRSIDREIELGLARTLVAIPAEELRRRYQELLFSLSISEAFQQLRALLIGRHRAIRRLDQALPALVLLAPQAIVFSWLVAMYLTLPDPSRPTSRRRLRPTWSLDEQWPFRGAFLCVIALPLYTFLCGLIISVPMGVVNKTYFSETGKIVNMTLGLCSTLTSASLGLLSGILPWSINVAVLGGNLECNVAFWAWIALVVISVRTVVPWYQLRQPDLVQFTSGRDWILVLPVLLLAMAALGVFIVPIVLLIEWLLSIGGILKIVVIGTYVVFQTIAVLFMLKDGITKLRRGLAAYLHDRRHFASWSVTDQIDRETIASDYAAFSTEKYRLRYVRRLIAHHPVVRGTWPGGIFPGSTNEPASIMLAQWEERLQRLD